MTATTAIPAAPAPSALPVSGSSPAALVLPKAWTSPARVFVLQCRAHWSRPALADSTGAELTYGQALIRSLALGRALRRAIGPQRYVGLLLPPLVPTSLANVALALEGRIPVNLNYTAGQDTIDSSIRQCGITHVITSQRALDRFKVELKAEVVLLEDLAKQVTAKDKALAALTARVVPMSLLPTLVPGLRPEVDRLDDTATVIFTSGSTGDPKGVVLSNSNVLSNVHAVGEHLRLKPDDAVLGVLPFFHSMGFTITCWVALGLAKKAVYHYNPLDARIIGELCEKHKITLLVGTPTFMRSYLHKCKPEQFRSVTHLVLGAEKLKPELARDIREKLGIEPLEGYGCTETSPVVAVNVPHEVKTTDGQSTSGNHPGTVGQPIVGTAIKTIDPDTGADLPQYAEGLVCVKGPQIMVGYLNKPETTAKVLIDGWYNTGDLGRLDPDGFLHVTGRLSRFSKIGGEMVPHEAIEAAIRQAAGVDEQHVAVTALPDLKRGERLVVLVKELGMTPAQVYKTLNAGTLPKLWIPSAEDFVEVESIPILGTGKIDLRGLRRIAEERLGSKVVTSG